MNLHPGPLENLAELSSFLFDGDSVLDLGCGLALLAGPTLPRLRSYRGIDFRADVLRQARDCVAGLPEVRFDPRDLRTEPLEASASDVVALVDFLHLPGLRPAALLQASRAVLNPGGRIIVSGPIRPQAPGKHGYYCSAEGMEALLKYVGFSEALVARPDLPRGGAYLVVARK
jgi:SAM-dependent methyltransferase